MNKLLIKLLKRIDDLLLWVEAATRWTRTKIQWLRWDLEDVVEMGGSNENSN